MSFDTANANIRFHTTSSAACSQFRINKEAPVKMTVSGPSRYTYLKLDAEQTRVVNELAKKVGRDHEDGPGSKTFMVYSGTFRPGQVVDGSRKATSEEKRIFEQIFKIAAASIAKTMGWSVSPADVTKIDLVTTVDFSFIKANRASRLIINLSQSATDRLGMDNNARFRKYGT